MELRSEIAAELAKGSDFANSPGYADCLNVADRILSLPRIKGALQLQQAVWDAAAEGERKSLGHSISTGTRRD